MLPLDSFGNNLHIYWMKNRAVVIPDELLKSIFNPTLLSQVDMLVVLRVAVADAG